MLVKQDAMYVQTHLQRPVKSPIVGYVSVRFLNTSETNGRA